MDQAELQTKKLLLDEAGKTEGYFYKLLQKRDLLESSLKMLQGQLDKSKKKHANILQSVMVQGESIEVMKKLVGIISEKGIKRLKGLLSYGLKAIFEDRDYAVAIEIEERGTSKTAEFYLEVMVDGEMKRRRVRDSIGGGVKSIIAIILQVYFIVQLGLRRFLILDESLVNVSDQYVPGLFDFIHHVIKDLGFKVLFISHDPRFLGYGDKIYHVSEGNVTLDRMQRGLKGGDGHD